MFLGFTSEGELELAISKIIKIKPKFENNPNLICRGLNNYRIN